MQFAISQLLVRPLSKHTRTTPLVGTVLANIILNWADMSLNRTLAGRLIKGLLLPLWLIFSLIINVIGALLDTIDGTGVFYSRVGVVAQKKEIT